MRVTRSTVLAIPLAVALFAVTLGAAHAQQSDRLSQARYTAFDRVYTAFVALEAGGNPSASANVRRVCVALDRRDRLLAATRTACLATLRLAPARKAFADCQTARGCSRGARRVRIAVSRAITASRASNRVVAAEVAAGPCRNELTTSRNQLRSMQKLRDGMRLLERGLLTRDSETVRRAEQLIADSVVLGRTQPTTQQSRMTFRRVCPPV